jgi:NADH:ubiquinone oxidoreductase subunit 5 (subunit L)/multisubunit Na+/H+ antiporter MnhA subunit
MFAVTNLAAARPRGHAEELEAFRRLRAGGDEAIRNELIERALPLAHQVARRYLRGGEPFEDLVQKAKTTSGQAARQDLGLLEFYGMMRNKGLDPRLWLGVLSALMQHDLKRLLAYHTVENIGIIFIGLGLALAFSAHGMRAPAALALTAALLHVFNHCLFKSLLFFGAGAVLNATGERDMEHLGGLIHNMPLTAFAFLTGCTAISALPPLNGFVSEWLTFQAILLSPQLPSWGLKFIVPAVGALLALSAALAAACFVKAFGVTFLGRARTPAAERAQETDRFSLAAMFFFAALCLVAGILPGLFIDALAPVVQGLVGARMPVQSGVDWLSIVPIAESRSSYNGLLVFLFMVVSGSLAAWAIHRLASDKLRRAPAWDCGYPDASPATQYTASSFAQPIRRVFGSVVFRAREHVEMPPPGDTRPARITVELRDLVWDLLYAPVAGLIGFAADRLNHLQFLTIRQFLSLVFAALVLLLLVLAIWQ